MVAGDDVRSQVAVAEYHTFGTTSSTRSVNDGSNVIGSGYASATITSELIVVGLDDFKGVHIKRGEKMTLRASKPLPVHVDGENFGCHKEVTVWLEDEILRIIG